MNTLTSLTPSAIMASGLKRISALADQHGITSPEVLDACTRWGSILDDVNFPDSTCRWCGNGVTHVWEGQKPGEGAWYHVDTNSKHCRTHAGAEATPTVADWGKVKARKMQVEQDAQAVRIEKNRVKNEIDVANAKERERLDQNQARLTKVRTIRPLIKGK